MVKGISLESGVSSELPTSCPRGVGRSAGVDVMAIIHDILDLPFDQMRDRILGSGMDLHIIQCEAPPGEEENLLAQPTGSIGLQTSEATMSSIVNQSDFDMLLLFSHLFSVHGYSSKMTDKDYQKYGELLLRISPYLPKDIQSRLLAVSRVSSPSINTKHGILEKNGLLPDTLIVRMLGNATEPINSSSPSPLTRLAFAGVISYKKIFQGLRNQGGIPPSSEMKDISYREYQAFVRETLKKGLGFLRSYLYGKDFWVYYEKTQGVAAMKSVFERFEALERGYSARIGQLELKALKTIDFILFYESYNSLVDELISNNAHPDGIAIDGVGAPV